MATEQPVAISTSLRLDDLLCFALYASSRAVTGVYRPLLDELGLTYPQYLVMAVLWDRGACAVKDLGAALHLDYGTLTPLLKRLETMGLVGRKRRSDDERGVEVTLTDEGVALRERAAEVPVQISHAFGLTADETATLNGLLCKVRENTAGYASKR